MRVELREFSRACYGSMLCGWFQSVIRILQVLASSLCEFSRACYGSMLCERFQSVIWVLHPVALVILSVWRRVVVRGFQIKNKIGKVSLMMDSFCTLDCGPPPPTRDYRDMVPAPYIGKGFDKPGRLSMNGRMKMHGKSIWNVTKLLEI